MAPSRKSGSGNKLFSAFNEVSPEKEASYSSRNKKKFDKLGSQWSKEELERFYDAYRKHGKDWKKAFSSVKEGEDAFLRIGQALDSMENNQSASNPTQVASGAHEHIREPPLSNEASGQNRVNESGRNVTQMPSELITSCVATSLMIQTCTERPYPPAEVAQILDSAVTSLHPCCPQNLPIYREIQMCMGRIKTQILALVPT